MVIYKHGDTKYSSLSALRRAFPTVSFPKNPRPEQLADLGVEVIEILAPEPTLDELKAAKKAEIASARYNAEIGGITYNGVTIATDRESRGLINGAVTQTLLTPSYSLQWKTSAGAIKLTSSKIQELGTVVREHVQACFDKEFELTAIIDACETVEEVAAVVWPE